MRGRLPNLVATTTLIAEAMDASRTGAGWRAARSFGTAPRAYIHTHAPEKYQGTPGRRCAKAEAELEAATKRSEVDAAAKKVMRAKEALKAAKEKAAKG